jgi:hypothetical protein
MDISEIWDNLGFIITPILASLIYIFARRIPRRSLRIFASACAAIIFLISGIALLAVGYYRLVLTVRCPAVVSPDGKHVAVTYWDGVIWDEEYVARAHVSIRSRYSPIAEEVFADQVVKHLLSDISKDPEVQWLDRHQLLISSKRDGQIRDCSPRRSRIDGIEVLCRQ